MRYTEFRDLIREDLRRKPAGLSWKELRERNGLPYARPCPAWTRRLEEEIGLRRIRREGMGNELFWTVSG